MTDGERHQINIWIVQISQGDISALEGLSRLISARMLSVAVSIVKNRASAEDVVQESFVKILRNAHKFSVGTNGYAWICKIVQNQALNTLRSEKRFSAANIDDYFDISAGLDIAEDSVAKLTLKNALCALDPLEKRLIYEKYFMDYTVRDSAESVGKSKSTVQRMLTAAEDKMKQFIRKG